ncbi:MAG: FMN-binding protein [Microgenomates group bacterium]
MNVKKNSFIVLGLVFGVSVLLYILDVPISPITHDAIPTVIPITISPSQPAPSSIPVTATYRQFQESISYYVKRRAESMTVQIYLEGQIVKDLQLNQVASNGESQQYQDAFAAEIKTLVVGKNINELQIDRIAGASYTSNAFMEALTKIKSTL